MARKEHRIVTRAVKPHGYTTWTRPNGHLVVEFEGAIIGEFSGSASDVRSWDNSWRPVKAHMKTRGIKFQAPRP